MQNEVLILDSNIWISYVITRRLDKLVTLILDHQLTVLTSRQLNYRVMTLREFELTYIR